MASQHRRRKGGVRKDKKVRLRNRGSEQPILGSVTRERGQATSNFTDGELAGPNWKRQEPPPGDDTRG
jgi:hypothetical protein